MRQELKLRAVPPAAWREACAAQLEAGARFCGARAGGRGGAPTWEAAFAHGARTLVLRTRPEGGAVDSVADLLAADWDEREAHEVHGLQFRGHEPLRALVEHPHPSSAWTVPVTGRGVHQVAVGPIHAGVIESGHFRFHVVGERILHLDPQLFYKRRGLEQAALGAEAAAGLAFAQRACGACAVANSVAYSQACENALGLAAPPEIRRARTVLLELERVYNHLNDVAAICAGVGFASGNMAFAALKERALRINAALAGHRFLFGSVALGANPFAADAGVADTARAELLELATDAALAWREVRFAASVQARLDGVGPLDREAAVGHGAVGPAARAAGVRHDARAESPGLWYGSSFEPALPARPGGDVAARLEVRPLELEASFAILEELLAAPVRRADAPPAAAPAPLGFARVESPRGETSCAVELEAGRLTGLRLRTGSYANWPALAAACAGELLPDFPLINKSFELCYACVDR